MSSGLTAPKCPSCKIILLRPVHYSSPNSSNPRKSSTIMHCPACSQQYSVKKGSIIPAIILASTSMPPGTQGGASPKNLSYSPVLRHTARVSSPLVTEAAALTLACCNLRSPVQLHPPHPPRNQPARSRSFRESFTDDESSKPSWMGSRARRRRRTHHRTGSLHLTIGQGTLAPPSGPISHSTSSDKLVPPSISTNFGGGKLRKIRAFLSGTVLGKDQSSPSGASSGPNPPPVTRGGRLVKLKRGMSLSDLRISGSETEASKGAAEKPHLSNIESLRQAFVSAHQTGGYEHVQELYSNTFSSWDSICDSFKLAGTDFGVNLDFVRYAYSAMMEMPQCVQKATMKSIINSFLKDSRNHVHTQQGERIKAQLILLENPQFDNPSTYVIFAQMLKQLSQMLPDTHNRVVCWLKTEYEPKWLKGLVVKTQHFISRRQFSQDDSGSSKTNWWIPCAIRVLSLIREASLSAHPPLLQHTEFYNTTLDHIDLMADFFTWQSPSNHSISKFSYCNHPFILSLSAKKYILQHDSEYQMLWTARRSLAKMHQSEAVDSQNVFLDLKIRRLHLIEDSINELVYKKNDLKKKVRVTFAGEPGVDMGGLTKEWFLLLVRKIFDPDYGLFTCYKHSNYFWFSLGLTGDHRSSEYNLVGLLMGLAVYNSIILDLNFPPCCFKKLLASPVSMAENSHDKDEVPTTGRLPSTQMGATKFSLDDLAIVMPTIAQGLKQLQGYEGDMDALCYTFQVSHQAYSTVVTTDLVPNGGNIPVTASNKNEFIELYIDHLLNKSISRQFLAFCHGFHSVCNTDALKLLCPEELEALICGYPEFDAETLRGVTTYDGYERTNNTIEFFWGVVSVMSAKEQRKLLQFVTGSNRVPVGGVSSIKFKISKLPFPSSTSTNILPMAHTCFNQLLLPPYQQEEVLREKLLIAISNSEGFGII